MATLTIRNVPDELHARLQVMAREHHRSLNREVIACLEEVTKQQSSDVDTFLRRAAAMRSRFQGSPVTPDELVDAAHTGQA